MTLSRPSSLVRTMMATLATLTALPAVALAQTQHVDRGFALDADGAVRVYNYVGTVRVVGWERDSVAVSGTMPSSLMFNGGGRSDGIKFGVFEGQTSDAMRADLVVMVPRAARVSVRGAATNIDVSGVSGAVDASTTSGRIVVRGTPREVTVETFGGDVDITASPPYLRAKTATGHIGWSGSSDDVALTTVTGRIAVTGGTIIRARFESIDGDILFIGTFARGAGVTFDTHSGNIALQLPRTANVGVESTMGRAPAQYQTVGSPGIGGPTVFARTFKGRITVTTTR